MTVFFSGSRRRRAAERSEVLPSPCLSQRAVVRRRRLAGGLPVPAAEGCCSRALGGGRQVRSCLNLYLRGCSKRRIELCETRWSRTPNNKSRVEQCSLGRGTTAPAEAGGPVSMPFYSLRGTARVVRFLLVSYTPLACSRLLQTFFWRREQLTAAPAARGTLRSPKKRLNSSDG